MSNFISIPEERGLDEPLLTVHAEGGRACSVVDGENQDECRVDFSGLQALLTSIGKNREDFQRIALTKPRNGPIHGSNVSHERLQQFGREIQELFRNEHSAAVIALVSSSKLPRYAMAAAAALSPDDLMNIRRPNSGKSLILAASRYPMGHPNDNVKFTLSQAMHLAGHSEMQGRAGVLYDKGLYPLTHLDANHGDPPMLDHSEKMAEHSKENGGWMFYDSSAPDTQLFGKLNRQVSIEGNVRTLVVPDASDEADTQPNLQSLMSAEFGSDLKGIILKTKGHRDPLTYTDPGLLKKLDELCLPVMLVGRRNNNQNGHAKIAGQNLAYARNAAHLLDGDGMYSGQAKVLLGALLGEATAEGIDDADVATRIDYIRNRLKTMEFFRDELRH